MKFGNLIILFPVFFLLIAGWDAKAQNDPAREHIASGGDNQVAFPPTDRVVPFNLADSGEYKPIFWGLDLAWLDEGNIRRGIAYMGKERVDVVRSSFMPTQPLNNGELQGDALVNTNRRIGIINRNLGDSTRVVLNCDHPSVHDYYFGNAKNWAALIDVTATMHREAGREVISVSPFNEPDYGWGQGDINDFYNIAVELRKNPRFESIRISGGNTLNCDEALPWYNFLQSQLDEGNTHQLAGSFDSYANFYTAVRGNGHHATNDELHNVMEAMVGVEYGLQTGIWWGTAERARGEFVKASDGRRLGYAEHRDNWTAASVYRAPDGRVQAFVGGSERQGVTTTFRFISKDRDVYFDGHGPQREFVMELPTGDPNTYGTPKHTNAERVIDISWGDDIQPVIDGKYILVNRNSGKVMETAGGSSANGTNIQQNTYNGGRYQHWNVNPINPRNGGDFSYFTITGDQSGKPVDILNASLETGANAILWDKGTWWDGRQSLNQVWYLEYVEDGWFFIRNQFSAQCLEVANNSAANGANIRQNEVDGGYNQQWRLVPVGAEVEFDAPSAPKDLVTTANAESVRLDWTAAPEDDVAGYTVLRSVSADGPYNIIARNIRTTAFVDNTCTQTGRYFYKVRAVDRALNSSEFSEVVEANTTGEPALVAHYKFNKNTLDSSSNLNHGASLGGIAFSAGKADSLALALDGEAAFVQLPATLANQEEITVATWVYWNGGTPWQRIFDFGNNVSEYMYLSPRMRFAIKNGGREQRLNAASLPAGEWVHVAVTLGDTYARMYRNGELVDEAADVTIRPADFSPVLNYIGRGQAAVPFFDGNIDDFRIYNYELSEEEIAAIVNDVTTHAEGAFAGPVRFEVYPVPVKNTVRFRFFPGNARGSASVGLYNVFGKLVKQKENININQGEIGVSELPNGIYVLKLTVGKDTLTKKIIVQH